MTGRTTMDVMAELALLRQNNNGVIELRQAQERGVTLAQLSRLVADHKLKRLDRNRYILPLERNDDMVVMARMDRRAMFSHETALYLHGLLAEQPEQMAITLPSGHKPDPVVRAECKLYYIGEPLMNLGTTLLPSPQGNLVPAYDLERTICDVARSRARVGMDIFLDAMVKYAANPQKDLARLHDYSDQLMVTSMVRSYLDPLLSANETF